ncbi:MAG: rhomboid family intramembrane serine protease [Thermoanaerobaculia bacterium]
MTQRAPATLLLFIAIVIGFGVEIATGAWQDGELLAKLGAIVPSYIIDRHEYWRLLSAMFLHGDGTIRGGLLHIGLNLWVLWQLGRLYEVMFGTRRFLLIYFVTGLAASLTSLMRYVLLQHEGSSVGASGAIFGVIGAFIFSIRRSPRFRNERWARGIVQQLLFWIVVNIAIGLTVPQIDMAAHVGGLVTGLILGATLPQREPPLPPSQAVIDVTPT